MKKTPLLTAILLTLALVATAADAAAATASETAFARLKQLEGDWQGTTDAGTPIVLRYHAAVNGSTLIETQSPGTDEEMISVYTISGDDLVMTHFCPMGKHGNQPRFKLEVDPRKPETIEFAFQGAANLDVAQDGHVHGGHFTFLSDGRLERTWTFYAKGKAAGGEKFVLSRKK